MQEEAKTIYIDDFDPSLVTFFRLALWNKSETKNLKWTDFTLDEVKAAAAFVTEDKEKLKDFKEIQEKMQKAHETLDGLDRHVIDNVGVSLCKTKRN